MRILILFVLPIVLFAHSLSVTASYEDGELFVESYFGDGTPCKECVFTVTNQEKEVFKNKLLHDGSFEEKVSLELPFTVYIDGGMGHWADVNIEIDETEVIPSEIENITNIMNPINETKIRQIIRSELNKQNSKIEVIVEKNRSTLEKMLVGLGYILGIFGLWQLIAQRVQQ